MGKIAELRPSYKAQEPVPGCSVGRWKSVHCLAGKSLLRQALALRRKRGQVQWESGERGQLMLETCNRRPARDRSCGEPRPTPVGVAAKGRRN